MTRSGDRWGVSLASRAIDGRLVAAILAVVGCGPPEAPAPQAEISIAGLGRLYGQFAMQNQGRSPANEAEFRTYIREQPEGRRKALGLSDVEAPWTSPRDGKPLVVRYGVEPPPPGPPGTPNPPPPTVIYEQEGRDGRRWVANAMGMIEEVDAARFKQLALDAAGP